MQSFWFEYSYNNSYTKLEENLKIKTLKNFIRKYKINSFLDIGCNTGIYSIAALSQGAKYGISIDSDEKSIDKLFIKAKLEKLNLLPLCVDLTNPSPNQGWLQSERKGFQDRFFTDASFSLAFMHHLVISKNIPLQQVIQFLVQFSDRGIIEYVPMDDEMAQILLRQRRNEITKYTKEQFEFELMRTKKIISKTKVKATGRILYEYA
ncbi:50S ribosomal protein L11 methyltransferase [Alphaproteobacteria bacterium]|nr:50S ribosomal protein L11 methyltransferase [Alphaproteobacteria bacterium]